MSTSPIWFGSFEACPTPGCTPQWPCGFCDWTNCHGCGNDATLDRAHLCEACCTRLGRTFVIGGADIPKGGIIQVAIDQIGDTYAVHVADAEGNLVGTVTVVAT